MNRELSVKMHAVVGLPSSIRILGVSIDGTSNRYLGELHTTGDPVTYWMRIYEQLESIYDNRLIHKDVLIMEFHWYVNNTSVLTHRKDKGSYDFLTPEKFCEGVVESLEIEEYRKRSMLTALFGKHDEPVPVPVWEVLL